MKVEFPLIEMLLVASSILLLVLYHLRLIFLTKNKPQKTAFGRHRKSRLAWLQAYAGGKNDLLVVHTLRNWIMSATFLASTAIFLTLGLLGFVFTTDRISTFAADLNVLGTTTPTVLLYKFLLLAAVFMSAFFLFSFSIRYLIHAGFVINIPSGQDEESAKLVPALELESGALFYFLGLRAYYLAVPVACWLVGPLWMAIATVLLIILLAYLD
jgi:uncharacterized membrane protein